MRTVPVFTIPFVEGAEASRTTAYRDTGGIWTIGVGHTGPEVGPGLVWTQAQVDAQLDKDLRHAAAELETKIGRGAVDRLSDHQYGAMLSFVFNLGISGSTIWKLLQAGKLDAVPAEMMRYTHGKDEKTGKLVEIKGLVNRRAAEVILWNTADATAAQTVVSVVPAAVAVAQAAAVAPPPSGELRAMQTPPAPGPVKPLAQSKSFIASASSAVFGSAAAAAPIIDGMSKGASKVNDAISPMAASSPWVGKMQQALVTIMAVLAVLALVLIWMKQHKATAESAVKP